MLTVARRWTRVGVRAKLHILMSFFPVLVLVYCSRNVTFLQAKDEPRMKGKSEG